jgi:hypothetical protein
MTLEDLDLFWVPASIVRETEQALRRAGKDGFELFVLWSGFRQQTAFSVQAHHVPRQNSYRLNEGLLVRVEGDALHALNTWLFRNGQTLGVQVHAHPTRAFHSETDDSFPIVTALGSLSLVAPDFGRRGLLIDDAAAYRLAARGWIQVAVRDVVKVVHDGIS